MTAEVERRIVEMQFENEQFEKGARQSLSTLEKLDNFLNEMSAVGVDKISSALDSLTYRFSAFGIAGAEAVRKVTDSLLGLASRMVNNTIGQIISGGTARATNIEQAKFQLKGLDVAWSNISDDIEYAVKQTAYGLDEAATAASILAAAGISWKNTEKTIAGNFDSASDMAHALRAISGIAAMTNSSYSDIASVLTDVAAAGRVTGDVITRLAYRGLNVTAVLAKTMGKSQDEIRKMMDEGKLSVQEFYKVMDQAFGDHATKANDTYAGSLMNIGAALSRVGADFVSIIHGSVENADSETERVEKGMIRVNNALRKMFDRLQEVTKVFAEGAFASGFNAITEKIAKIIDKVNFEWLKPIFNLASRFLDFISRGIDKITAFGHTIYNLLHPVHELDEELENGSKQFWVDWKSFHRFEKIQKIFLAIKEAVRMAKDTILRFGRALNTISGGGLSKLFDWLLTAGAKISDLFLNNTGDIWSKIDGFMVKLEKFGVSLKNIFGTSLQIVWTLLTRVWNTLKDAGVFTFLGNAISWAGDKLLDLTQKLEEFLGKLFGTIKTGTIWDSIKLIFGKIGTFIENAIKKIKEFFGYFKIDIDKEKITSGLGKVGAFISDIFKKIGEAFSTVFGSKDGSGNKVANAASTILAAFLSFRKLERVKWILDRIKRFFSFLTGGTKWLEPFSDVPNKVQTILGRIAGSLRAFTDNMNAKSMKEIAIAVGLLTLSLIALSLIPEEKLERAMGHLVTLMVVLAGVFVLLSDALVGAGWTMSMMGPTILAFGAAVLLLAASLWILSKIEPEKLKTGWQALSLMLLSMAATFVALDSLKPAKMMAAGFAILLISVSLLLITAALGILGQFKPEKLKVAWEALSLMLLSIVGTLVLLSEINPAKMMGAGVAILAMSAGLILIALALAGLAWIDPDKLKNSCEALSLMLLSMAGIFLVLGEMNPASMLATSFAFLIVAAAMDVFALALAGLALIEPDKLKAAWEALSLMLLSMAGVFIVLNEMSPLNMIATALSMAVLAAALIEICLPLMLLSGFDADGLKAAWEALSLMLLSMAGVFLVLGEMNPIKMIGTAAAMWVLSKTIWSIAFGLTMLSGVDADGLKAGWQALSLMLLSIAGTLVLLSEMKPLKMIAAAAALVIATASISVIAKGLQGIAEAVSENENAVYAAERVLIVLGLALAGLGAIGPMVLVGALALVVAAASLLVAGYGLKVIGEALPVLADGIRAFEGIGLQPILAAFGSMIALLPAFLALPFATFGMLGVTVLTALGTALPILADGIAAFGRVSGWDLVKVLGGVATGIGSILAIKIAKNGVNDFYTVAVGLDMIAEAVLKIPEDIGRILKDFAKGVETGVPEINNALNSLIKVMVDSFNTDVMRRNWITIGRNIVVGIANGINTNGYIAQNALTRLANSLQRSFSVQLAIRSPSRVFEQLAEYIPEGIALGIQNGTPVITDAMMSSMSGALQYMQEVGNNAQNYTPQIRPVMDLNGMRSGMLYADQMLQGSTLGRMGNISGLNVNGDAISYNMQNDSIVAELHVLETEIARLGKAIEDLELVMDTGMVVGALAPKMNQELGVMAVRERRQ